MRFLIFLGVGIVCCSLFCRVDPGFGSGSGGTHDCRGGRRRREMGCVSSKQAVTVTPAFDHSGQFKEKGSSGGIVVGKDGGGGRSNAGSGRVDSGRSGRVGWQEVDGRQKDARAGKDGVRVEETESVSFRLGNLHKYVEGEQVAAGWPAWLSAVAGEAIQGWVPLRSDTFEKLEKVKNFVCSNVWYYYT